MTEVMTKTKKSMMKVEIGRAREFGRVNWLGLWTLYKKEVARFMRIIPQTLLAPMVSNVLLMTVFVVAFPGRSGDNGGEFISFLIPGLIMLGILNNAAANSSSSMMTSKVNGSITDVLMPPLSAMELAIGFIGGAITRGVLVAFSTYLALSIFFTLITPAVPWAVLYFGLSAAACLSMVGLLSGVWAEKFDQLAVVNQFIIMPLSMLSGTFYHINVLSDNFQKISLVNPLFYFIDGFRYGFLGEADSNILTGVIFTSGLNIVLFIACVRVLKSGWRLKA